MPALIHYMQINQARAEVREAIVKRLRLLSAEMGTEIREVEGRILARPRATASLPG